MEHIGLTALIKADETGVVTLCPELGIASEGETVEEARETLTEALALFFEVALGEEVARRLRRDVFVTRIDVAVG